MKGNNVGTYDTLNDVLVNLFRDINSIEEKAITSQEYKDLTNNDMHVISAIGVGTTKNMSSIAKELSVTVGTLTISMKGPTATGRARLRPAWSAPASPYAMSSGG